MKNYGTQQTQMNQN